MQPSDRQPPRFVPTLTEVVEPAVVPPTWLPDPAQDVPDQVPVQPVSVAEAPPTPASVSVPAMTPDALRDQGLALAQTLQLRVMERLDGVLEERLRYALADVVQGAVVTVGGGHAVDGHDRPLSVKNLMEG